MRDTPNAATRLFLLLGDPVEQSRSPVIQNTAIRQRGINAIYAALRCDRQSVGPLIRALCRANGGGNVTIPHKAAAAECLERPSRAVSRTGVCNAFWGEGDVICGDNTDVTGFAHAASMVLPELADTEALIVGAGGAAAAAACALLDAGARSITLLNRSPDRARILAARLDPDGRVVRIATSVNELVATSPDLVVNATPEGMRERDTSPIDFSIFRNVRAAIDVIYRHDAITPFVREARRFGIPAADGREMLVAQGAAAFSLWFGGEPPFELMRDALVAALSEPNVSP